ncbi:MAG: PqqD family protein [Elusimicrobia bacterium]|nr:PqqD family protein [Elusimicrobiota bacterium]
MPTKTRPTEKLKPSAKIAWRKVADEAVILNTETAAYYSLDGAGLRIWELLSEGRSIEEIVGTLADEYDASSEVLRRDALDLLSNLRKEKIVEPA